MGHPIGRRIACRLALAALWTLAAPMAAHGQAKGLTIAANPNLSPIELLNNFGPLARALERELGVKVDLVSGKDYDDTIRLLKTGQADIAGTGAFGYVGAHDEFGAKLIVRYVEDGGESYRAVIIARADSNIEGVKDLRGKRFAFTDPKSTSGYLMPLLALQQHGLDVKDLGRVEFVKKQPNSAIAVYTRQVDAGAIADNQLNEKYGVKLDELKIIWKSPPIPHGVWMARPSMPDDEVRRIARAILKVAQSAEVKAALAQASVRGFAEGRDSDFDFVRSARQLLEKLEKQERKDKP
ncbi:MAG TPA: phosphate/phosphite/phosphonate ABC transporter substrate-binding protein [Paucimonas sp.]|nr:phosphate/phosphite/phosphonate ABC transporter substrate-binding protein [Paucimonas sp.]